ncbi:hypothetical protein [Helicobacter turcicus]|uniref:Uncharacterized protein n=1 Tax=Helicobacter turcicus TaxID=2867412 RepID=A0ABS7JN48_9HELI|nr:hypothetical protein [Helicobacter turcicus]MBX7490826.1 hypothetical protein [Helicobacter turcicus]MBX7545565.1 hypothetical protein [Helicobacter turcicus]
MAVTPVGNMTYINQNAQVGSMQQANTQVKLDFQSMVNLQNLQDNQEEIQEVRPTEETLEVKDEREGNGKQEKDEEEKHEEQKEQDSTLKESQNTIQANDDGTIAHLDISV